MSYSGVLVVTLSCKVPFYCFNFRVVILAPCHITTTIHTSSALVRLFMNSTTINFITEFMQTMLSKRQTSPPRCNARHPSNHLTQAQGAQVAGQAASQHASPAAFQVASPRTNVPFTSSTRLTRSSMFPDAIATTSPDSADANSTFNGLTLIPEVLGISEMPTESKKL